MYYKPIDTICINLTWISYKEFGSKSERGKKLRGGTTFFFLNGNKIGFHAVK